MQPLKRMLAKISQFSRSTTAERYLIYVAPVKSKERLLDSASRCQNCKVS